MKIKKRKYPTGTLTAIVFLLVLALFYVNTHFLNSKKILVNKIVLPTIYPVSITSSPTPTPTVVVAQPAYKQTIQSNNSNAPWGISQQIDQHTWTIRVGQDSTMATPQDILTALNNYRNTKGRSSLSWSDNLGSYAQSRAEYFNQSGNIDEHKGFNDFLTNQDGFNKLGFSHLGENSSIGYHLIGVHIIEWIYASDAEHDANQLDSSWSSVGIGVSGTATDLVFGGN